MVWLYLIVFIFALSFLYAAWRAAPWLPMHAEDLQRAVALAKPQAGEKFIDLGSGDGRTLLAFARAGTYSEGYEISLLPYLIATAKAFFFQGQNRPKTFFRDFWNINLGEADIIFVFLMPRIMDRLREKMERELKPGTRIVCYTWPMPGWDPVAVDNISGRPKIYLYQKL